MKKFLKHLPGPVVGAAYASLTILVSRLLIRSLSGLFGRIGGLAGLDDETLSYGTAVLSQLKSAVISSPWLPALLIGAAAGALIAYLTGRSKKKRIVIHLLLWILLLIPLTLTALWFTEVNAISIGALLKVMLPMLPHLL